MKKFVSRELRSSARITVLSTIVAIFLMACGGEDILSPDVKAKSNIDTKRYALYPGAPTGDRGRLLWEATRAMVGPYQADSYQWSTSPTLASWPYLTEDWNAWNVLRNNDAYYDYGKTGYYVSCMRYYLEGDLYQPCYLQFGSFDPLYYYTNNPGCDWGYRGGQCKAFTNLVAYRSTVYRGAGGAFKALPSDGQIYHRPPTIERATQWNIQAGDILRSKEICISGNCGRHSVIVARKYSSSQIVVVDSNWVRLADPSHGNGCEQIGSHVMAFTGGYGTGGYGNLANYYRLNCVYDGNCP